MLAAFGTWKHHFVGAVCYADDVALLAPSPSALRSMLNTCIILLNNTTLMPTTYQVL